MNLDSNGAQLYFVTVRIDVDLERGDNGLTKSCGTGLLIEVPVADGGTVPMVATNRHVLDGSTALELTLSRVGDSGQPLLGQSTSAKLRFEDDFWFAHPDESIDIAVFPFAPFVNEMSNNEGTPCYRTLGPEYFASNDFLEELSAIEDVIFVGYPNGMRDSVNHLPIARRGMTATPPSVDYEGKPTFLIDASVFPGSSGSPVFVHNEGGYASQGGFVIGGRLRLLGLVASTYQRAVEGSLVAIPTDLRLVTTETIDIGVVYKAGAILEAADALLGHHGFTRTDARAASVSSPPHEGGAGQENVDS